MTQHAPRIAPYGTWRSPITAADHAAGATPLREPRLEGENLYWLEGRPLEGGRTVLMVRDPSGTIRQLTPEGFNVRTRVHEYGGGVHAVHGERAYFSHAGDGRLYAQDSDTAPIPLTPAPADGSSLRYADLCVSGDGRWLVCVQEVHDRGEVANRLVFIPTDGSSPPRVLAEGEDFYAYPRLSPDGRKLAWISWNHPSMPWDRTTLWTAEMSSRGECSRPERLTGDAHSLFQPSWSPNGDLYVVSDQSGWWNLYRVGGQELTPVAPVDAECGTPLWVFGLSTYCFLADGRIAVVYSSGGIDNLGIISPGSERIVPVSLPYTAYPGPHLTAGASRLACLAAGTDLPASLVIIEPESGSHEIVRGSIEKLPSPAFISAAESLSCPGPDGPIHALYYAPLNPDFQAPSTERPPLIVQSHGGPTSRSLAALDLEKQFWTTRGFAVVDVNYGGSSGFGRAYRERLNGQWGVVDTRDCIAVARYLASEDRVDPARMVIRGSSAGGYTTLCALTFHDDFAAGASYYGVADLETLAQDTHKFESRYLDGLVGPYPEDQAVYRERSPIHFADRIRCPVIVFQGLQDKVVPPSQAEQLVDSLRRNGVPHAYLTFAEEQHGFRAATTIQRALEAELTFYAWVLNLALLEPLPALPIVTRAGVVEAGKAL